MFDGGFIIRAYSLVYFFVFLLSQHDIMISRQAIDGSIKIGGMGGEEGIRCLLFFFSFFSSFPMKDLT